MPHPPINVPGKNRLLECLPAEDRRRIEARLEPVTAPQGFVLYEANGPISHVYFPTDGMVSLILSTSEGLSVETGTVGNEGMLGTPLYLGAERSPNKVFFEVAGKCLRMRDSDFTEALSWSPTLDRLVRRFTQSLVNQVSQSVACGSLHTVEERLCRWLLMTHDRMSSDELPLTQEFLAQMLGARRPTVTVVAGILQQAGLIRYSRGKVTILDRRLVEEAACECYGVVRSELDRLLSP